MKKDPDAPVFERYARPRGMDNVSAMLMQCFRKNQTEIDILCAINCGQAQYWLS